MSQFTPTQLRIATASTRWYVVHTKSRQEKALAGELGARAYEFFLPLATITRYVGRRKLLSQIPLFPGYVFVFATVEQSYEVDRTDRVAQVIAVRDQDSLVRDLAPVHAALLRDAPLQPWTPIALGEFVEVKSGPFRGLRGRVDQGARGGRLVLQVDLIGRAAVLEIEESLLDRVTA